MSYALADKKLGSRQICVHVSPNVKLRLKCPSRNFQKYRSGTKQKCHARCFAQNIIFLPGVKLQGLRELRVVVVVLVVVVVVVVVVVMWCFYLPGHLPTTFAKQLL